MDHATYNWYWAMEAENSRSANKTQLKCMQRPENYTHRKTCTQIAKRRRKLSFLNVCGSRIPLAFHPRRENGTFTEADPDGGDDYDEPDGSRNRHAGHERHAERERYAEHEWHAEHGCYAEPGRWHAGTLPYIHPAPKLLVASPFDFCAVC
jgi:hypothetical protein